MHVKVGYSSIFSESDPGKVLFLLIACAEELELPCRCHLRGMKSRSLKSPLEFNIRNAVEKVVKDGDAWEGMDAYAVELHTHRKIKSYQSEKTAYIR